MIDGSCSRKSFLAFGLCTLASGLVGCSEDPGTTPRADGGTSGGGTGTLGGGSAGTGGSGGAMATAGTSGGGSSGSSGTSGSGGSSGSGAGGGGTAGSGENGGTGGSSGGIASSGSGGGPFTICPVDLVAQCSPAASDGHTHVLVITANAINAGEDVLLVTEPDQTGHSHMVDFTATDFLILKDEGLVVKDECGQGPHQFVVK